MSDMQRQLAISEWMANVYREASERGITDAEVASTFSREAATLLRAMVRAGDIKATPIGSAADGA